MYTPREGPREIRKSLLKKGLAPVQRPQLVVISATMRNRLKTAFFGAFGWFRRGKTTKLSKNHQRVNPRPGYGFNPDVTHHVLLVGQDGTATNVPGAVTLDVDNSSALDESIVDPDTDDMPFDEDEHELEFSDTPDKKLIDRPPTYKPHLLECIAVTFAMDVPQRALLILPSDGSVDRAILDLRALGVNAFGLDLLKDEQFSSRLAERSEGFHSEPTLLVSTVATTRGIDFPSLSHVFILGLPAEPRSDTYLHLGGRVGRFGQKGKVITVLEQGEEPIDDKVPVNDEAAKMKRMLKSIKIIPAKLERFD